MVSSLLACEVIIVGGDGDSSSFELKGMSDVMNEQHSGDVLLLTPQALPMNNLTS